MLIDPTEARSFILFLVLFAPFEFLFPIRRGQKVIRNGWVTDVLHFFVTAIMSRIGMFAVIVLAIEMGAMVVPVALRAWIRELPFWLQVVVATALSDLGFYAAHRLMHAVPALWSFHTIHHSSEQMDWLASYRVHPVDQIIVKGSSYVPVFMLGFSEVAIGLAAILYHWQALILHSNINLRLGPLKWLVATPEFHHWHHARDPEARDKNFAGQLPLWDVVFKTAHVPDGRMPEHYGVDVPVPLNYIDHLVYPFSARVRRGPEGNQPANLNSDGAFQAERLGSSSRN